MADRPRHRGHWLLPAVIVTAAAALLFLVVAPWRNEAQLPPPASTVDASLDQSRLPPVVGAADAPPPRLLSADVREAERALVPDGPLATSYAVLAELARAGNSEAALHLARTLALCARFEDRARAEVDSALIDYFALARPKQSDGDDAVEAAHIADLVTQVDRQYALCPGLSATAIDRSDDARIAWLERAAHLGHPQAMVELAGNLISRWRRRGDIIDKVEEVREVRRRAIALLQHAASAGEPSALLRLATAHRSGDLASIDPVSAYAYSLAYRAGPPMPEMPPLLMAQLHDQLAALLSAEQRDEAAERAEAIRARCCADD